MLNLAIAIGVVVAAAVVARWSPALGGVVAMLPTKAIAFTIILMGANSHETLRAGVQGMLAGTLLTTLPLLLFLWWWTR